MTNSLSEMIKGLDVGITPENEDLDIKIKDTLKEEIDLMQNIEERVGIKRKQIISETNEAISVLSFPEWFEKNNDKFPNVRQIKLSVRGVDPMKNMMFSVADPLGGIDSNGDDKRELFLIKNADKYVVLNLKTIAMDMYNNGFKIIYATKTKDIFLKCYGTRTGLEVVHCININNILIPFFRSKLKKRDTSIIHVTLNKSTIENILPKEVDKEALQIMYRQLTKCVNNVETNQDMVNWFDERSKTVVDLNHFIQIDDVIISLIKAATEKEI